jgi:hypothetical protein
MRRTPYAALSRLGSASWALARSEQFRLVVPADGNFPPTTSTGPSTSASSVTQPSTGSSGSAGPLVDAIVPSFHGVDAR